MVDANGKRYENIRVNNVADKQDIQGCQAVGPGCPCGGRRQPQPVSSFKLVSSSDPAPTQSCSQANIDDAIQFMYIKLMTNAVNEIKNNLKPSFHRPYLWVSVQNMLRI
jgi:hypothetical protein